jgi:hypothetical protein
VKLNNKCKVIFDEDGALIFNPQTHSVISYNQTGTEILKLIKKGYKKDKIVKELSKLYKVGEKILTEDLNDFLLEQKKLKVI